jgi:hypothetical protein
MSNTGIVVFLILSGMVVFLVWDTYFMNNLEKVQSRVDGNTYWVQPLPDKQEAADLLARIRKHLDTLIQHLQKIAPDDERTKQVVQRFQSDQLSEGVDSQKYTSYSINKGERIVFCLRKRDKENALMDLNTMMFVALHELAHVATDSVGHTEEFWDNFRWLLEEAIQIGIYKKQDFQAKPVPYCGISITDSPLEHD